MALPVEFQKYGRALAELNKTHNLPSTMAPFVHHLEAVKPQPRVVCSKVSIKCARSYFIFLAIALDASPKAIELTVLLYLTLEMIPGSYFVSPHWRALLADNTPLTSP